MPVLNSVRGGVRNFLSQWRPLNVRLDRYFMKLLNYIPNTPDPARISKVGPDAACAEWILKLGGAVRFENQSKWTGDYNSLPSVTDENYTPGICLAEIDASETSVLFIGFLNLRGTSVQKIKLDNCKYVDDKCLLSLYVNINKSLQYLHVSRCPKVTDDGLSHLQHCSNLKKLILFELQGVKEFQNAVQILQQTLPDCQIVTDKSFA